MPVLACSTQIITQTHLVVMIILKHPGRLVYQLASWHIFILVYFKFVK